MNDENASSPDKKPDVNHILIGEKGDILARYRIPVDNSKIDYNLELPKDSDSSNFSSENEGEGAGGGSPKSSGSQKKEAGAEEEEKA